MKKEHFNDHIWKDILTEEMIEIYTPYQRDTFVGRNPAILAIDLYQNAYLGGKGPAREANRKHAGSCGENAWNAIPHTQRLFAAARAAGVPVVYSTRHADTSGVKSTNRSMKGESEVGYVIQEEVFPQPGELVIYKERASAFFGTPLIAHLRRLGVDSLIICGQSTSGCVRASTIDAYSYGFHNVLVEECTYDRSMLNHKVNLFDMHNKYADVMHVEEVVAHLEKSTRKAA
jgi:nicotinamidase-related amidase